MRCLWYTASIGRPKRAPPAGSSHSQLQKCGVSSTTDCRAATAASITSVFSKATRPASASALAPKPQRASITTSAMLR